MNDIILYPKNSLKSKKITLLVKLFKPLHLFIYLDFMFIPSSGFFKFLLKSKF